MSHVPRACRVGWRRTIPASPTAGWWYWWTIGCRAAPTASRASARVRRATSSGVRSSRKCEKAVRRPKPRLALPPPPPARATHTVPCPPSAVSAARALPSFRRLCRPCPALLPPSLSPVPCPPSARPSAASALSSARAP
eukprot:6688756-Prymnesium_polylepis.1